MKNVKINFSNEKKKRERKQFQEEIKFSRKSKEMIMKGE